MCFLSKESILKSKFFDKVLCSSREPTELFLAGQLIIIIAFLNISTFRNTFILNCIFCQIVQGQQPAYEIYRDQQCVAILDVFPLKAGHILLISNQHAERFEQLPIDVAQHMATVAQRLAKAQAKAGFGEQGYNIVVNNGKVANQHIPHVHLHLIPRSRFDSIYLTWRYFTRFIDLTPAERKRNRFEHIAAQIKHYLD